LATAAKECGKRTGSGRFCTSEIGAGGRGWRAGATRRLAGACRDARLPSRGRFDAAGRWIGPLRGAGAADGAAIARSEHRVSFSMSRR